MMPIVSSEAVKHSSDLTSKGEAAAATARMDERPLSYSSSAI
jgi:hypothetical protein